MQYGTLRERNEATRRAAQNPNATSVNFLENRGAFGQRFAGAHDMLSEPNMDSETLGTMRGLGVLGNYKDQNTAGVYYGNYDPTQASNAGTIMDLAGYKPTEGAYTDELKNVFGQTPAAYGKNFISKESQYDPTTLPGLQGLMGSFGYKDVTDPYNSNDKGLSFLYGNTDVGKLANRYFSKSDLPTISEGLQEGMTKEQVDDLRYNIMKDGQKLGVGYYDPKTYLNNQLASSRSQAQQATAQANTPEGRDRIAQGYRDLGIDEASIQALMSQSENSATIGLQGGIGYDPASDSNYTGEWNNYSDNDPRLWNLYAQKVAPADYQGLQSQDRIPNQLSGEYALAGSTPIFKNGKVVGYKQQLGMDPYNELAHQNTYLAPSGVTSPNGHTKFDYDTNNTYYRDFSKLNSGGSPGLYNLGNNNAFISADNAKDFVGFGQGVNSYDSNISAKDTSSGVMKWSGPVIGAAASLINPYAGAFMNSALSGFNPKATALSFAGAGLSGLTSGWGQAIGDATGLGTTAGNAIAGAGRGAIMGGINGQFGGSGIGFGRGALAGAASGGLSSLGGSLVRDAIGPGVTSDVLGGAVSGGLGSLAGSAAGGKHINPEDAILKAFSGAAGGLGSNLYGPSQQDRAEGNRIGTTGANLLANIYKRNKRNV